MKEESNNFKSTRHESPRSARQSYRPLIRQGELEKISAYGGKLLNPNQWNWKEEADQFFSLHVSERTDDHFVLNLKTPLDEAQAKIYEALGVPARKKRIELAREALQISPDCADAYILMAKETEKKTERGVLDLYRKAVQAGRRALGPEYFKRKPGLFWFDLKSRPFLRALYGLGETLWYEGHEDDSFACFKEIIELDPRDHLGARHFLLPALLDGGRLGEARILLDRMEGEESALFQYSRALYLYLTEGGSVSAGQALIKAFAFNPWVPMCLNFEIGDFFNIGTSSPGSVEEAIIYAYNWGTTWYWKADGTRPIDWLLELLARLPGASDYEQLKLEEATERQGLLKMLDQSFLQIQERRNGKEAYSL